MWVPWAFEIGTDILLGFLLAMVLMGPAKPTMPPDQQTTRVAMSGPPTFTDAGGSGEVKVSSKITPGNRCLVPGVYANGRGPFEMMADSGAPDLWFTVADLPKLGIKQSSLDFESMGDREGLVAWITLPEVRIGDFVARNVDAAISQRDLPESRLLGMSILKQGHVEVAGNTCTLTFPHNAARPGRIAASIKPGRPQ
jgi:hypothetical protein